MSLNNKNDNIVFSSLRDAEEQHNLIQDIPEGYIEVRLSTKGKFGAPAVFHVRNFKVKDILTLSLSSMQDLPIRLISILNGMIWEDVDVSQWHEKEIEELMVYIFLTFFKNELTDIPFPYTEEDLNALKEGPNGENLLNDIKTKKWTPTTTINITKDVETYDLPDDANPNITITNKKTGFHITFGFIKYGDQIILKNWLDSFYRDQEMKFKAIKEKLDYNGRLLTQIEENASIIDKLISIDPDEQKAYDEYLTQRLQTLSELVKIISILDYNGIDVSNLSVSEKYEMISTDARLDYGMISKLSKRQSKLQIGLKPEVSMRNPFTGEVVKRPFSFQVITLLQAMQVSGDDNYDDGYDDET